MRNACGVAVLLGALAVAGCDNPCDLGEPVDPCGPALQCHPGTYCLADAGPLSCALTKPLDSACNRAVECVSGACQGPSEELGPFVDGGHCVPGACF